jgi:gluconokinase
VIEADHVRIPHGLFAYRIDGRRWVVGGALSEGGGVVQWLCTMFGLVPGIELDAEVDGMRPDSHGLTILPFAAGERSPGWSDDARCTITGLTLGTRPVAIVRAALESVAFRFQLIANRLREVAPLTEEIVGSGGALLASPAWCRILADVLGRRLVVPECAESSSRGAALLALEATGDIDSLDGVPPPGSRTVEPDPSVDDVYRAAAARQQKLYDAIHS